VTPTTTTTSTTTLAPVTTTSTTTLLGTPACGDPNGDGFTDIRDVIRMLRAAVALTDCSLRHCDINRSGAVTVADALAGVIYIVSGTGAPSCPTGVTFSIPETATLGGLEFDATGIYAGAGLNVDCAIPTPVAAGAAFNSGTGISVALAYPVVGQDTPATILECTTDSQLADIIVSGLLAVDVFGLPSAVTVEKGVR